MTRQALNLYLNPQSLISPPTPSPKISSFLEHYYPSPQQNVSTCTHHTHSSTSHHTSTITHTICATQSSKTFVNPTPFGPLPHPLKECTYGICCLFKSEQSFSYLPSPFLTFQLAPLDNRSLAHLWFPCTQNDPHIMSPILLLPPKFSPLFYSSFLRFLASSLPPPLLSFFFLPLSRLPLPLPPCKFVQH